MTKNIAKIVLLVVLAAGSSFMYFFSTKSNDNLEQFSPTRVEYMIKNAKLYGQGVYIGFYGEKYEVKWKHGIYHGKGIYTFSDGIKWIGEWREDKPWNITEYSKNGEVNGKMVNGMQK